MLPELLQIFPLPSPPKLGTGLHQVSHSPGQVFLPQASLGRFQQSFKDASLPGCLLQVEVPLNPQSCEVLLYCRVMENGLDDSVGSLEGLRIVQQHPGLHSPPSTESLETPNKCHGAKILHQDQMHCSSRTARVETQPIFSVLHIERSSEVDSSVGERPALLNSESRECW